MRYLWLGIAFLLIGCCCGGDRDGTASASRWQPAPLIYQLQGMNPDELAVSGAQILVTDYSRDGTDDGQYTQAEITRLKNAGVTVLCYFSIGEAEDYRFYWDETWATTPPSWLGDENPDWEGNYKVKYWENDWFDDALEPYLDRLTDMGCDGAFLDIVDAFEYWPGVSGSAVENNETLAAHYMIDLIAKIAAQARSVDSGFLIFPQNAEWILDYDTNGSYKNTINGIAIEDLFYDRTAKNSVEWVSGRTVYLDALRDLDKTVLITDYVDDGSGYQGANKTRIDDFLTRVQAKGYWGFAARENRELDRGTGYGVKP